MRHAKLSQNRDIPCSVRLLHVVMILQNLFHVVEVTGDFGHVPSSPQDLGDLRDDLRDLRAGSSVELEEMEFRAEGFLRVLYEEPRVGGDDGGDLGVCEPIASQEFQDRVWVSFRVEAGF